MKRRNTALVALKLVHIALLSFVLLLSTPLNHHVSTVSAVPIEFYGLNYNTRQGADWNPTKCETYEQVKRDLTVLSRVTSRIRILSLYDCGQGELVLQIAQELGNIQVWLGLWVSEDETVFEKELVLLEDFLQRGLIDSNVLGITVGSEAIYREEVTIDENIEYMNRAKSLLAENGYGDILVSIVDIAPTYQFNIRLTNAVDIVVTNSFPFWESVPIDEATDYLVEEFDPLEEMASAQGKEVLMGETGWPSDGFIPGVGVASEDNQVQFFVDFYCRMGQELNWKYFFFTGIDNAWRQEQDPNNTIEGNWGFLYHTLELKPGFQGLTFTCPNDPSGVQHSFDETDWSVPEIEVAPTISPPPASTASCQAHPACAELGLGGNCCPNDDGLALGCCGSSNGDSTTASSSPAEASPMETTTGEPTTSPTMTTLPPLVSTTMTQAPSTIQSAAPAQDSPTLAPFSSPTITSVETPTAAPSSTIVETSPDSSSSSAPEPTGQPSAGDASGTPQPTLPTLESFAGETSNASHPLLGCAATFLVFVGTLIHGLL